MSSGHKRLVMNLQERATSPDFNRAQTFIAMRAAEAFRRLFGMGTAMPWDLGAPVGEWTVPTAVDTPLRADVFGGLMVEPVAGSSSLHVGSGVLGVQDPDGQVGSSQATPADPDDSPYKLVYDAGISTGGVLTIAANAGPGARVDVIECQRVENLDESDTREVFDTGTGVFASTLVDKVRSAGLTYRVRQGTPGAGYPGNVQGWLPLAVAHVPSGGGSSTDDVDFWDVRPLVADRVYRPFRSDNGGVGHKKDRLWLYVDRTTSIFQARIIGSAWGEIDGMQAGGRLTKGIPGTDADLYYIEASAAGGVREPGFAAVSGDFYYLWLIFPFGLPRWVRYSRSAISGHRIPWGMRGVPVLSLTGPNTRNHSVPAAAIGIPASTGLDPSNLAPVSKGFCVYTGLMSGSPASVTSVLCSDDWCVLATPPAAIASPTPGGATDSYSLTEGVDFPADARALKVVLEMELTGTAGARYYVNPVITVGAPGVFSGAITVDTWTEGGVLDGSGNATIRRMVEIPRPFIDTDYGLSTVLTVRATWQITGGTKGSEQLTVRGWRQAG